MFAFKMLLKSFWVWHLRPAHRTREDQGCFCCSFLVTSMLLLLRLLLGILLLRLDLLLPTSHYSGSDKTQQILHQLQCRHIVGYATCTLPACFFMTVVPDPLNRPHWLIMCWTGRITQHAGLWCQPNLTELATEATNGGVSLIVVRRDSGKWEAD